MPVREDGVPKERIIYYDGRAIGEVLEVGMPETEIDLEVLVYYAEK